MIRRQVNDEFDRVARSFRSVAGKQSDAVRADTEAIIAILEEKRAAVMRREQVGYFIHDRRKWPLGGFMEKPKFGTRGCSVTGSRPLQSLQHVVASSPILETRGISNRGGHVWSL